MPEGGARVGRMDPESACHPALCGAWTGGTGGLCANLDQRGVMPVPWLVFWSITEIVIIIAAVWPWCSRRAMYVGRVAVATLFLAGQCSTR
jgi:hypothetical protein